MLANDADVDGDALAVIGHAAAAHGTFAIAAADGSVRSTPDPGFSHVGVIEYTVSDGTVSATGPLTVTVVNAMPTLALAGDAQVDEAAP